MALCGLEWEAQGRFPAGLGCDLAPSPPPLAFSSPSLMTCCLVAGCGIMWYSLALVLVFSSPFLSSPSFLTQGAQEGGSGEESSPLDLLALSFF